MSRRAGRPALLESDGGARSCFTIAVSQRAPIQSASSQPLSSPHQSPPAHQPHAQAKIRLLNLRLGLESCIRSSYLSMTSERISNTTSDIECHARDIARADCFAQEVSESPVFPTR